MDLGLRPLQRCPDDATSNPATAPIQVYHMGVWFADANDASKGGLREYRDAFRR